MIDQVLPPLGDTENPLDVSPNRTQPAEAMAPLSVVDVEAERARIRQDLTFRFRPLSGNGKECTLSVKKYGERPYRHIVEELFLALWETSSALHSNTARSSVYSLESFFAFLDDVASPVSAARNPAAMRDLNFALMRDYEHYLFAQPARGNSLREERLETLGAHLAQAPLPTRKGSNKGSTIVSISAIERALDFSGSYVTHDPEFYEIVASAAKSQGLLMPQSRVLRWARQRPRDTKTQSVTSVENDYYTLTKLIRHILKRRRHLLADDFLMAEFESTGGDSKLRTSSLAPAEHEILRSACLAAARGVKARILVEGPARAARGRALPDPDRGETAAAWGDDLDNLAAYLHRFAPGELIGQQSRPKHSVYASGVTSGEIRRHPLDVATMLAPGRDDWASFIMLLGMNEHAPLNLEGLMTLHVDTQNEREHCVRPSPTPGYKRVFFGKPRAGVDQGYIDVPARSELDVPGLIETAIKLTAGLRDHCRPEDKHLLWLYLARGGVKALKSLDVSAGLLRRFIVKNDVKHAGKLLLDVYFRRLRPTALSNVAFSNGIDEAQRRASHADPAQTLAYVNNPTNERRLRNTVFNAQSKALASVQAGFAARPPTDMVRKLALELEIPEGAALEIILGKRDKLFSACIDDKNGRGPMPKGKTCGKYESCLVCVNSVIVERHLVRLIAYQRHWLNMAVEMSAEAWEEVHALNCAIVDEHLTKFDPAVVAAARARAEDGPPPIAYRKFKQS